LLDSERRRSGYFFIGWVDVRITGKTEVRDVVFITVIPVPAEHKNSVGMRDMKKAHKAPFYFLKLSIRTVDF